LQRQLSSAFTEPLGPTFRMKRYLLLRNGDDVGAICEIGCPPISTTQQPELQAANDFT
jgi:hypothetical protein